MFHHIQTTHPEHWNWETHRVRSLGVNFRKLLAISEKELITVAPNHIRPYPGTVGNTADDEDEPIISNKRAAVEALIRETSQDSEDSGKRLRLS